MLRYILRFFVPKIPNTNLLKQTLLEAETMRDVALILDHRLLIDLQPNVEYHIILDRGATPVLHITLSSD